MSSDLSDVLRDMADDRRDPSRRPAQDAHDVHAHNEHEAPSEPAADPANDAEALHAIRDAAGDPDEASSTGAPGPRSGIQPRPARKENLQLQAAAVPVLITVGGLLLLLGIWGTAVLAGSEVVLSDRPGADRMARAMILTGYPLGGCLLAGAGYFLYRIRRAKRSASRRG